MKQAKKIALGLLYPGTARIILLTALAIPALAATFAFGWEDTLLGIASYVLSAYALTILALGLPRIIRRAKAVAYGNPYSNRYLTDLPFRVQVSLWLSLAVNLLFALFKLVAGIFYGSVWFGAVAVYYILLCVMRVFLLRHMADTGQDLAGQYRKYRFCGSLLFVLNIALSSMALQMIRDGKGYEYPGLLIYVFAAYAFYCLTLSIINMVKYRRLDSPVLWAAKALNFATALVAMLSLQTAMFASFGGDAMLQKIMNITTGSGVCLVLSGMALYMIVHANRQLKRLEETPRG